MGLNSVPREFRDKLRWIPHPPYHIHAARRAVDALIRLVRLFEFKGDERIKVRREDHGEAGCKVYQPVDPTRDAAMLWIHGGGWRTGSKGNAGPARTLVSQGFAVVNVEYRLSGEAIFPAQIQDCKAAVRADYTPTTRSEWDYWIHCGEKRNCRIPSDPEREYSEQGTWISWEDFLTN